MRGRIYDFAANHPTEAVIPPDAPARVSFALVPQGERHARDLPSCNRCRAYDACQQTNVLNYAAGDWVEQFARPECEAAITGAAPDIASLLQDGPRTVSQLARETQLSRDTVRRKLIELRAVGVNVVAYGANVEALYGYGPAAVRSTLISRIIALLRRDGPLTARAIAERLELPDKTVRKSVAALASSGRLRATIRVKTKSGRAAGNWSYLWEPTEQAKEEEGEEYEL